MCVTEYDILTKVRTTARIVEGEAGRVICREAERIRPAAVVMGTRGRSLIQRFIQILSLLFFTSLMA